MARRGAGGAEDWSGDVRCRMNVNYVCEVCSVPAELLLRLDQVWKQCFPWNEYGFGCFGKPMGFQPWERTIRIPRPNPKAQP